VSLTAVVAALRGAISPSGQIDLYAASADPALAPLRPMLARFTITSSFIVSGARLSPSANAATLVATGAWGLSSAPAAKVTPVTVRLDATAYGTDPVDFTLTVNLTKPGWTFGDSFPFIPDSMLAETTGVRPVTSFLYTARVDSPTFATTSAIDAPLTMAGNLPMATLWRPWESLVGPWPLRLLGTAVLPVTAGAPPTLDLLATAASAPRPLKNPLLALDLSLSDLGFGLVSAPGTDPADPVTDAYSVLNLSGRIAVGGLVARLTCPILSTGRLWHFIVTFEHGSTVEDMSQLTQLFGLPDLPTPADFLPIRSFKFSSIEFYVEPGAGPLTVAYVAVAVETTRSWTSPAPFITLDKLGISWLWGHGPIDGVPTGWLAATIYGSVAFGTDQPFHIDGIVQIPAWSASAELREGDVIPITAAFREYFGAGGPPTPSDMNVVGLAIDADPGEQSYYASADIIFGPPQEIRLIAAPEGVLIEEDEPRQQGWTIDLLITEITLRSLSFHISVVGGALGGGIAGVFLFTRSQDDAWIEDDGVAPAFLLSAEYPGPAKDHPEGWTFAGELLPGAAINLPGLVSRFLGQSSVPSWVPPLNVDRLYFSFNTGTPGDTRTGYTFGGTISLKWNPEILGTTLKISAAASIDMAKPATSDSASGKLSGLFAINRLELTASMTLGVPETIYQFKVQFGDLWFEALTSWRDKPEPRHQVISLQLGGVTIGGILEYLVNLAAPTLGYSLDPPWDILNQIELSRFTLTLDPQASTVELVYAANADLVFMRLDTIGVRYKRGENSGVSLFLTGSLLGKPYTGDDLSWDVVNESPPALPGQGETFIQLRYLGLGQRVQLRQLPNTVAATLDLLKGELKEPVPGKNPMEGQGVEWSPVSQWLIGLDIGLLDTIDLGIIFNDPWIYGLSIALGGEKAGSLSGLRFEILYKKISDTVGMFRIELTVPEAFRHFEFGEVSVTLGVVVIEIYTNGNFKIDLGFPYNRNYARSFTVEVFPFLGRGGIYFGLLDGTTSQRVPKITNGNFAPVIELGVGLAVGVGKEISYGPLSAGIYVEVEVIFEGVLGWFHPSAAGGESDIYYWAQGVAAIHGKLYGSVDFKVIKASVTLEAYAAATVTLEAFRPTVFKLEVSVRAEAEVTILFIPVSFSFDVNLDVSFQVGQEQPTPWILAGDQSRNPLHAPDLAALALGVDSLERRGARGRARGAALRRAPAPRRRPERRRAALRADHQNRLIATAAKDAGAAVATLNWQPAKPVFTDSPRTAQLILIPAFTVADVPLSWTSTQPNNAAPAYRFAMQLFAPTGVSVNARNAAQARDRSAAMAIHAETEDDLDALAADILVKGILLYALYALPGGPQSPADTVTAGQLDLLASMLNDPESVGDGFVLGTVANPGKLSQFYNANIHLAISGLPSGDPKPGAQNSMAMAMPPFMGWTSPQTDPVDFLSDNKIGPLYLWGAQVAAAKFSPSSQVPPKPLHDPLAEYVSFASHVFSDWNLLLAKSAVREALSSLDDRVLAAATATDTLSTLAHGVASATVTYPVRPGDTVETVADSLGATVEEIDFLNPNLAHDLGQTSAGGSVNVLLGVSPGVLAVDNPKAELQKTSLPLGDITVPVAAADTLNALANRYGVTGAAILGVPEQSGDAKMLAPGALFNAPATDWTAAPSGFTALLAAAVFYVRYAGVPTADMPDGPAAAWYAQALGQMNREVLKNTDVDPRTGELPPATQLAVPTAHLNATPLPGGDYMSVPGDTLARIGAALNLQQNEATTPGETGWPFFRDRVTGSGATYSIPAFIRSAILPGETFAMLARRTVVNWVSNGTPAPVWSANWVGLADWIGDAYVLAPLTLITIPAVVTDATTNYTFDGLAKAYGLTLADVGSRLAAVPGLVDGVTLIVKHLPAATVQYLLDRIRVTAVGGISQEASRYLFSGQEIPVPVAVPGPSGHVEASADQVSPLFDETRQQWDLPVDRTQPTAIALALDLTAQVPWITLFESTTVGVEETSAALAARVPGAFEAGVNRALAAGRVMPAGALIHVAETTTLSYSVTNQEVLDAVPVTALVWVPHKAPAAVPVKGEAWVTYSFARHIGLQTAIPLPVPGFDIAKNTLSVYPFPGPLQTRARTHVTTAYRVYASEPGTAHAVRVASCTYGCLVAFTVRRIVEAPGVYQLIGAAVEQLPLVLDLISYLTDPLTPPGTVAHIALPPSSTAADPTGLALLGGDAWFIKSNLSTETVPSTLGAVRADDPPPLCRADLADPASFALLLWEGSSIGGIGYTFGVEGGLADGSFDANDQATLQFTVVCGAQQAAAPTGRTLLPFNTSLLVVDQAVPDGAALFAEAHDPVDPTERVVQALVPAGSTGFELTLTRPTVPSGGVAPEDQENALRQQYSLVTAVASASNNCPYAIPPSGLPAAPQAWDGKDRSLVERARARRQGVADDPDPRHYWAYQTVLPIYRFGPASVTPKVTGLPPPEEDPYRGLGNATVAPQVAFQLGVGDVLGNRSAAADDYPLSVAVGYTDPLNGPAGWPSVNSYYAVVKEGAAVTLSITLTAKAQALMPAVAQRGDALVQSAIRQRDLYATIYYQYAQPNLAATIETTLQMGAALPVQGMAGLGAFAAGEYLTAHGAALYGAVRPAAAALGAIVADYGIGWEALATVNAAVPLSTIFGAGVAITVPAYAVVASGDTANSIAAVPRPGWPAPSASEILNVRQNANLLPLKTGAVLVYPPRPVSVPDPAPTLATLATGQATSASWLAADSATDAILVAGFTFTVDEVQVVVGQTVLSGGGIVATFADAVLAFADLGVHLSAADLGLYYADAPNLLIAGATAHSAHYLVGGPVDTYPSRPVAVPDPAPSLAAFAAAQVTSASLLASDSASDAILTAGFTFTVHGVGVIVGQTTQPGGGTVETFADAVAAFARRGIPTSAADLGLYYADAPNLLIAGATAHSAHRLVGEPTLANNPSGASTADLVAANLGTPDLYEAGALIYLGGFGVGDPPKLTPAGMDTVASFAARYACPPAALLAANASLVVIAETGPAVPGTGLAIPGAAALPDSALISVPYRIRADDILSVIAAGFDLASSPNKATALADRNASLPGTVAQGLSFDVDVDGTPVPVNTTGLASFGAVLAKVRETAPAATMADVAAAFEFPGRLAAGGLLVCPPALLASATKPSAIGGLYGIRASAFGLANAGTTGLLIPGVELASPDRGMRAVTTAAYDTLNSVVGRFNDFYVAAGRQATATVAGVIDANLDALLFAAGARALLSPADIVLTAALNSTGPYPGAAFPLTVDLVVRRPANLIHAGFENSNVEGARATIAAPAATPVQGGSMTFDAFQKALREALPDLRLATAKMEDHAADLWAVNFGTAGITEARIFPDVTFGDKKLARMIGLAPLYGELVSRAQVPIAALVAGQLDPAHKPGHDYQGIDVEIWASRFLSDFDQLLNPANAAALNATVDLRAQYVRLMTAKRTLQAAIPGDLASIFKVNPAAGPNDPRAVTDPNLAAGLEEARRVFGQSLGVSLSAAWATAAIVQYDGTVNSAWTRGPDLSGTAALYGEARSKTADPTVRSQLAAGKLSLSETAPFLTLPLSVSDPGSQSQVSLNLAYAVSNLEIHRRPVGAAPGYTQSDWLAMTPVLTGADLPRALGVDLGETHVPITLKAFPALPLIVSQTGLGNPTEPPTLTTASLWTFRLVYSHQHAAQDHVGVTAEFNLSPPPRDALFAEIPQDLFTALAQYIAVADELNGLLTGLTDPKRGVTPSVLASAVTTFADLANQIARLWGTRLPNTVGNAPASGDDWIAAESQPFSAVIGPKDGTARQLAYYQLTRLEGAVGPELAWPDVACQTADGSWAPLIVQKTEGGVRTYVPEPCAELVLSAWPSFALSWPNLNVGTVQNGRAKLQVVRNVDLLGAGGPATAEAFVYRTALVTAANVVTPTISRTDPMPIIGATVEAALQTAFNALFPSAARRPDLKLTLGLFYGYTVVSGPDPLVSELPVGLIPDHTLDDATAGLVAGALQAWRDNVQPNRKGGLWVISLMLYSSIDPGKRVLLSIDRLTYALA
jgi:LysM repeat protein